MNQRTAKRQEAMRQGQQDENWNPIQARKRMIELEQMTVSFKNIATQMHKTMFVFACELRKLDKDNRVFSNGMISGALVQKLDKAIAHKITDLPPEAYTDFKGDNKAGISPDHLRGGK